MQLDHLEAAGQPDLALHGWQGAADLVVPPLPSLGDVAVAEPEQRRLRVERGHGPEAEPVHMRGDVSPPGDEQVVAVPHGLAVHRDDVVQPPGELLRPPRHDAHRHWPGHATSAGVPAVMRTSSSNVVGKTAGGTPPAAHTSSY